LIEGANPTRSDGLGALHLFSDSLLLEVLGFCAKDELICLAIVSRPLYAFSVHDELWRTMTLSEFGGDWQYMWNWRTTYLARSFGIPPCKIAALQRLPPQIPPTNAKGLYSDVLYHSFLCASSPIHPKWMSFDNLARARADISVDNFESTFEAPNIPVILKGAAGNGKFPGWERGAWSAQALSESLPLSVTFHCAGFEITLPSYLNYMERVRDDHALYLFDKKFVEKAPCLGGYSPPPSLDRDLFSVLGPSRPDWRWLIMGPRRSGSVFHKDPNGTSAWNICLQGRKKWILVPPGMTPPGVFTSADGSQVCGPLTVMEWMLQFYSHYARQRDKRLREVGGGSTTQSPCNGEVSAASRKRPLHHRNSPQAVPLQPVYEGIQEEGDCVFVPRGWWHCVLNLEEVNVAVTQNFCSPLALPNVLKFLKEKPFAVSGVPSEDASTLYPRFIEKLKESHPELVREEIAQGVKRANSTWQEVTAQDDRRVSFSLTSTWGGAKETSTNV